MTRKPEQMPFDLGHAAAWGREDYRVSGCNEEAFAWIGKWPEWNAPALVLHGPPASGKTHLAHIWKERAKDKGRLVDDALQFIGNAEKERELFHLYNAAKEQGISLLLTAATPPQEWPIELPDLKSRLLAAPAVALRAPDDELIGVVMAKMFSDRQIFVPQDVIAYALPRMERSFAAARALVAAIDQKALAEKRPVTVPLVRDLL